MIMYLCIVEIRGSITTMPTGKGFCILLNFILCTLILFCGCFVLNYHKQSPTWGTYEAGEILKVCQVLITIICLIPLLDPCLRLCKRRPVLNLCSRHVILISSHDSDHINVHFNRPCHLYYHLQLLFIIFFAQVLDTYTAMVRDINHVVSYVS